MKKKKKLSHKTAPKKQPKIKAKQIPKASKKAPKKVVVKKSKPVAKQVKKAAAKPVAKPITKIVTKQVVKPIAKTLIKKTILPPPPPKAPEPKPKGLYSLEYEINSSPDVLFEFISTPGGLEKWFADRVYIIEGNFIFNWEHGEKRLAKQIAVKDKEWVRFHWLDEAEKRYFEFKIVIDDLTSEVALIVSDFADNPKELEESTRLWNQQMQDLHYSIGSP